MGLSQKQFAERAGGSVRGIQENEAGKTVPGGEVLAVFSAAGINPDWVVTGALPKLLKDLGVEQSRPQYDVLNTELLALVIEHVDVLLKESTPRQRANLVNLAYDHMTKAKAADAPTLVEFLRKWQMTSAVEPAPPDFRSPEVRGGKNGSPLERRRLREPVGDDDKQGSTYTRRQSDK